jgi:hypothetical protein
MLILAGAGTGKTATIAHLVLQGVDPMRVLLLTFSRRAAPGARLLRRHADQLGLDPGFGILAGYRLQSLATFEPPAAARPQWPQFAAPMTALAAPDARCSGQLERVRAAIWRATLGSTRTI